MKILPLLLLLLTVGCTHMGSKQAQKDIYSLQARVLHLEQSAKLNRSGGTSVGSGVADMNATVQTMEQTLSRLRGEVDTLKATGVSNPSLSGGSDSAAASGDLDGIERRLSVLEKSQKLILSQLTMFGKRGSVSSSSGSNPSVKSEDVSAPKPAEVNNYESLRAAYNKKNYTAVIGSAQKIMGSLQGARKTMVIYYLADSYYMTKSFRKSAINFSDYLEVSTNEKRGAAAKLKLADCFLQLGDKDTAKIYLDEIVDKHAKSKEAKVAGDILEGLNKKL